MADITKGAWLNTDTGNVVHTEPENGRLLLAPGSEVTAEVKDMIERFAADYAENAPREDVAPKPANKSAK